MKKLQITNKQINFKEATIEKLRKTNKDFNITSEYDAYTGIVYITISLKFQGEYFEAHANIDRKGKVSYDGGFLFYEFDDDILPYHDPVRTETMHIIESKTSLYHTTRYTDETHTKLQQPWVALQLIETKTARVRVRLSDTYIIGQLNMDDELNIKFTFEKVVYPEI